MSYIIAWSFFLVLRWIPLVLCLTGDINDKWPMLKTPCICKISKYGFVFLYGCRWGQALQLIFPRLIPECYRWFLNSLSLLCAYRISYDWFARFCLSLCEPQIATSYYGIYKAMDKFYISGILPLVRLFWCCQTLSTEYSRLQPAQACKAIHSLRSTSVTLRFTVLRLALCHLLDSSVFFTSNTSCVFLKIQQPCPYPLSCFSKIMSIWTLNRSCQQPWQPVTVAQHTSSGSYRFLSRWLIHYDFPF